MSASGARACLAWGAFVVIQCPLQERCSEPFPCVCLEESANGVKGSEVPAVKVERDGRHEHHAVGNGFTNDSGSDGAEEGVESLPSLAARGSLSDEVFSNLPEDLQELLRSASSFCEWGPVGRRLRW